MSGAVRGVPVERQLQRHDEIQIDENKVDRLQGSEHSI